MPRSKKPVSYLELGVGSAERLASMKPKRGSLRIGIDLNRRKAWHIKAGERVRREAPGARLVYGKKGDIKTFLRGMINEGRPVQRINAEYVFANLGKQLPFPEAAWSNIEIANKEAGDILGLAKQVLTPRGVIRMEVCKFDSHRWKKVLEENGFTVGRVTKVPEDKVRSWWGRRYLRSNRRYQHDDYEPTQIVAKLKG